MRIHILNNYILYDPWNILNIFSEIKIHLNYLVFCYQCWDVKHRYSYSKTPFAESIIFDFLRVHLFAFCTCSSHPPGPDAALPPPPPSLHTSAGLCCAFVLDPVMHTTVGQCLTNRWKPLLLCSFIRILYEAEIVLRGWKIKTLFIFRGYREWTVSSACKNNLNIYTKVKKCVVSRFFVLKKLLLFSKLKKIIR